MKRSQVYFVSLLPYGAILVAVWGCLGMWWYHGRLQDRLQKENLQKIQQETELRAKLISNLVSNDADLVRLEEVLRNYQDEGCRLSLYDGHGRLVADSEPRSAENVSDLGRGDFLRVLEGNPIYGSRNSRDRSIRFYAVPLEVDGQRMVFCSVASASFFTKVSSWINVFLLMGIISSLVPLLLMLGYVLLYYYIPLNRLLRYAKLISESKLKTSLESFPAGWATEFATELESITDQLRKMADSLHRLEFFRRDFIANISHEVKTPITTILASVENLKLCGSVDTEAGQECMASLVRQTRRLNLLIQDILRLSELEDMQDHDQRVFFPLEVRPLLEETQMDLSGLAKKAGIELLLSPECYNGTILGDADLLHQAISNLVINAIRHSHSPRIELDAREELHAVTILVRDFGIGITEEHRIRIFERFYRLDQARSSSSERGSGLGLAIVKHIVLLHNGTIAVHDTIPHGCTFSITIPSSEPA